MTVVTAKFKSYDSLIHIYYDKKKKNIIMLMQYYMVYVVRNLVIDIMVNFSWIFFFIVTCLSTVL